MFIIIVYFVCLDKNYAVKYYNFNSVLLFNYLPKRYFTNAADLYAEIWLNFIAKFLQRGVKKLSYEARILENFVIYYQITKFSKIQAFRLYIYPALKDRAIDLQ